MRRLPLPGAAIEEGGVGRLQHPGARGGKTLHELFEVVDVAAQRRFGLTRLASLGVERRELEVDVDDHFAGPLERADRRHPAADLDQLIPLRAALFIALLACALLVGHEAIEAELHLLAVELDVVDGHLEVVLNGLPDLLGRIRLQGVEALEIIEGPGGRIQRVERDRLACLKRHPPVGVGGGHLG